MLNALNIVETTGNAIWMFKKKHFLRLQVTVLCTG
jgi:hypothetical protein